MNLSPHPDELCLYLEIPFPAASDMACAAEEVHGRHQMEKRIQELFFQRKLPAFVQEGSGVILRGAIFILTDSPVATLRELKSFLGSYNVGGHHTDLLPYVHLGWFDKADNLWRSFHPLTTRPFWTLLADQEKITAIIEKGRLVKA